MTITAAAVVRLALLGLVGGILQLTAVSQITIFGVPVDLSPLIVASVGFLAGSVPGAVLRLLLRAVHRHRADADARRQLAGAHRVGYGAGRIRELRDPAHGLAPVAVGAAATAIAALGFTLLQFLLGVEAPVSLLLVRQILMTIVLNTLLALPVYALCAACCCRSCPTTRAAAGAGPTRPAA